MRHPTHHFNQFAVLIGQRPIVLGGLLRQPISPTGAVAGERQRLSKSEARFGQRPQCRWPSRAASPLSAAEGALEEQTARDSRGVLKTRNMTNALTAAERFKTQPSDHRFFGLMAVVSAAVILTGFGSSYGPKVLAGGAGVPAIIHLHAVVFCCWLALFVTQVVLVIRGRLALHQRLGTVGIGLAGLMLVLGVFAAITVTRQGHRGIPGVEFPHPAGFLLLNINAILAFAILVAAAWYFRRTPQAHKRLMLLATVGGLAPPGIARLPGLSGHTPAIAAVVFLFLIAGPIYDLVTRKRVHAAYGWAFVPAILTAPPVVVGLSGTQTWQAMATWMMAL